MNNFLEFRSAWQEFIRSLNQEQEVSTPCGQKISPSQAHIIMYLNQNQNDQEINQNELVRLLKIDKSNVTRLCNNLEKAGWITREKSKIDGRNHHLKLSQKGKNLAIKIEKSSEEYILLLLKQFSPKKQKELINMLNILTEANRSFKLKN